ncbi:MAG: hypothetical protein Alis3KO_00820 [Aliiglaciecola sp.]
MTKPLKTKYQAYLDEGRKKRLKAELYAHNTRTAVQFPESTYHATYAMYFRQGWNSVTLQDIEDVIRNSGLSKHVQRINLNNLKHARRLIGGSQ